MSKLDALTAALQAALGGRIQSLKTEFGEITVTLAAADYFAAATILRDDPSLRFEQLLDLCGLDYSAYGDGGIAVGTTGLRYAVAAHLLSITHNWRVRLKVFCPDDDLPLLMAITPVWSSASWYEREAFDLFGIIFDGHEDLRRILTDYGFIGHPMRKDFPTSGNVEMRYDAEQKRVIYQAVTIEPREITPRIIREANYGGI